MPKQNLMEKDIKLEVSVEEFIGLLNRRDNMYFLIKILDSKYYQDDPIIREAVDFLRCFNSDFNNLIDRIKEEIYDLTTDES